MGYRPTVEINSLLPWEQHQSIHEHRTLVTLFLPTVTTIAFQYRFGGNVQPMHSASALTHHTLKVFPCCELQVPFLKTREPAQEG